MSLKNLLKTLLLSYAICVSTKVQTQNHTLDSLKKKLSENIKPNEKAKTLLNVAGEYLEIDLKKAITYAKKARKLAIKYNLKEEKVRVSNALGFFYGRLGKYTEAEKYYQIALKYAKKYKTKTSIASSYANLANVKHQIKQNKEAVEYGLKALKIYESLADEESVARVLSNLGNYLSAAGYKRKAIEYVEKGLKLKEKLQDKQGIVSALNNLGNFYSEIGKPKKAIRSLKRAEKVSKKEGFLFSLSITYTTLGIIYDEQKQYQKAQSYHEEALKISQKIGDILGISINSENLGKNLYHQNQIPKALEYLEKSLKIAQKEKYTENIINVKKDLSEVYTKMGQHAKAYKLAIAFAKTQDSLNQSQQKEVLAEMQTRYETEKKNQKIELLTKENKINTLTITNQRQQTYWLIALSVLLFLLGFVLWNRYQIKLKTGKILEDKNAKLQQLNALKDKLFATIAHDLKNPLSGFRAITQSLSTNLENISKTDIDYFVQELNQSAQKLFDLLQNLLNWAISQIDRLPYEPETIDVKEAFSKTMNVLKMNIVEKKLDINYQIEEDLKVYADKNMLQSILRNLLSNAIKFSEESQKITLKGRKKNEKVVLEVQDEGLGMNQEDVQKLFKIEEDVHSIGESEEKGTGLGLILCKELADKQKGNISCESSLGKGSSFYLELPLQNT